MFRWTLKKYFIWMHQLILHVITQKISLMKSILKTKLSTITIDNSLSLFLNNETSKYIILQRFKTISETEWKTSHSFCCFERNYQMGFKSKVTTSTFRASLWKVLRGYVSLIKTPQGRSCLQEIFLVSLEVFMICKCKSRFKGNLVLNVNI